MTEPYRHLTLPPLCFTVLAMALPAQCDALIPTGDPVPDVVGQVMAITAWDPDGAGPSGPVPTIAGRFAAGNAMTSVAFHDGSQWNAIGAPDRSAQSLTIFGGQLVVGRTGGVDVWNGTSWQTIGTTTGALGTDVNALTTYQGMLVAGGSFSSINGIAVGGIAQWNGAAWAPLGVGTNGPIHAMAVFNGSLHVGGSFSTAGGVPHQNYGIWNGSAWAASPDFNATIRALAARTGSTLTNSFLFAGGSFTAIGTAPNQVPAGMIARFSPSTNTWADFSSASPSDPCHALMVRSTGLNSYEVAAMQSPTLTTLPYYVKKWSAGTWSPVGTAFTEVLHSLGFVGGAYIVGKSGAMGNGGVQRFNGTAWEAVTGPGFRRTATAVCDGGGDVVLADGSGVQRGAPGAWTPMPGLVGSVRALARTTNGDIVAGGVLTMASGAAVSGIARWNGTTWNPLAGGVNGEVEVLLPLPNGELIVGGLFSLAGALPAANIARWTGSAWQALGGGTNDRVRALLTLPGGDLAVAGDFTASGVSATTTPRIARWDGAAWTPMTTGAGFDQPIHTLALHPSGLMFAGGTFTTYDTNACVGLARWSGGTTWTPLPASSLLAHRLLALGSGDLLVMAVPTPTAPGLLVRMGSSLAMPIEGSVLDLQPAANGDALVAGAFVFAGGVVSQGFARYTTPCPATANQIGAGCAGTTLTAGTLPWTGSTYRATASALPAPAFVLHVLGFTAMQPALPLTAVLPPSLPGCALHASPDVVEASVVLTGDQAFQLTVPWNVNLHGTTLFEQVVAMQVGPGTTITAVTASNALQLTIGVF